MAKVLKDKDDHSSQLVTFKVGHEEYSVPILKVQEIIKMVDITRVPNSFSYVEGVINLRGKVMPVIDLRKRLGLADLGISGETRIIVVDGDRGLVGFIVHSVSEVMRLSSSVVEAPPDSVGEGRGEYIDGVGKIEGRIVSLLNIERVLEQ